MSDAISDGYTTARDYCWATEDGRHGTLTVAQLEAAGWVKVREHEVYRGSWLMRREPC
jgi:hypothetical protein